MLVTALSPKIGYDNAAKIAKKALKNNTSLKEEALKSGLIREKEYKLYPKQNNYLFDKSVNNYKYAWKTMSVLITKIIIFLIDFW